MGSPLCLTGLTSSHFQGSNFEFGGSCLADSLVIEKTNDQCSRLVCRLKKDENKVKLFYRRYLKARLERGQSVTNTNSFSYKNQLELMQQATTKIEYWLRETPCTMRIGMLDLHLSDVYFGRYRCSITVVFGVLVWFGGNIELAIKRLV